MKRNETRKGPIWVALLHLSRVKPWNVAQSIIEVQSGLVNHHHTRWLERVSDPAGALPRHTFVHPDN